MPVKCQSPDAFGDKNAVLDGVGDQAHMELAPGLGDGWVETLRLDRGLLIGLCDYQIHQTFEGGYSGDGGYSKQTTFGFNLLISGSFDLLFEDKDAYEAVQSNRLYLCRGAFENLRYRQHNGSVIRGLSIEMPSSMVQAWMTHSCDKTARTLEKLTRSPYPPDHPLFNRLVPMSCSSGDLWTITRTGAGLLSMPRDTICARLQFESRVLDLLAIMLSLDHTCRAGISNSHPKRRAAVDEAVDILRAEWSSPPTISALARRVGTNECYLKMGFRQCTGLSIGGFVRKLRMENALELIESGECNVLQTAHSVGYSNPSHFSAAFKRFYGRSPSFYLTHT